MSGRMFEMSESEGDGSATDGDENEQDLPNHDGFDENETEPASGQPVKKKRAVLTREFTEFDRWDRSDCTDEDILVFIRRHLDQCNMDAGIQHVPGKHKDRKNVYGDFQLRRKWSTNRNMVNNTILSCPLRDRCNCQCQAKIVETPVQTILYFTSMHTAADHVATKDHSKYLKHAQRNMIATAVKIAPLKSAGELIGTVQNSQTKEIDAALRQSVVLLVRKERINPGAKQEPGHNIATSSCTW